MGKTGYFTHRDCWKHDMGPGHPECPARLDAIEDRLLVTGVGDALERIEVPLATLPQITRAHSVAHIEHLEALSQRLVEDAPAGGPDHAQIDPDTTLTRFTVLAARRAAGAAIAATDAVIAGEIDNAFCAVRPPGHHACRDKAMGFCFFNNIADRGAPCDRRARAGARGHRRLRRAPRQRHRGHPEQRPARADGRHLPAPVLSRTAAPSTRRRTCSTCRSRPTPRAWTCAS